MSTTTLLVILSVCEFALIALGFVVYFAFKKFRQAKNVKVTGEIGTSIIQKNLTDFASLLQEQLTNTEERIKVCSQKDAELLKSRAEFIKSELLAANISDQEDEDVYWFGICKRMTDILPTVKPSNNGSDHSSFTELGDIDEEDNGQLNEPPVLENNIAIDISAETESVEQESDLAEITRLRKIIARQHNAITDLKRVLSEQNLEVEVKTILENKLEETEVAHAQLSMCIASLDTEIFSLESQLKTQAFDLERYQSTESDSPILENSVVESVEVESKNDPADEPSDQATQEDATTILFDESEDAGDLSTPIPADGSDELANIEISDLSVEIDALSTDSPAKNETIEEDTPAVDESVTAVSLDDAGDLSTPMASNDIDELDDIEIGDITAEIDALSIDSTAENETTEADTAANDESMPSNLDAAIEEMMDLTADKGAK